MFRLFRKPIELHGGLAIHEIFYVLGGRPAKRVANNGLLDEISQTLRLRGVLSPATIEAMSRVAHPSQALYRHCTKLLKLELLRAERQMNRKDKTLKGTTRYFPGRRLFDPMLTYPFSRTLAEIQSIAPPDTYSVGTVSLVGVSRLKQRKDSRGDSCKSLMEDITTVTKELSNNLLKMFEDELNAAVVRHQSRMRDWEDRLEKANADGVPSRRQVKRFEEELDSINSDYEKTLPPLPIVLIDLNRLYRLVPML